MSFKWDHGQFDSSDGSDDYNNWTQPWSIMKPIIELREEEEIEESCNVSFIDELTKLPNELATMILLKLDDYQLSQLEKVSYLRDIINSDYFIKQRVHERIQYAINYVAPLEQSTMQLISYGAQDVYLTGNPQLTFFKTQYSKYTNFSYAAT